MRTFISIELPEEIKKEILKIQEKIEKSKMIKGRFTEPDNLHLTLKFLGEIDEDKVEDIKNKLKNIKFDKFEISLDNLGVFSKDFIKIVWLGVEGERLFELQKSIDNALSDIFPKEERFMGHITIMRPKYVENKKHFIEMLAKINFEKREFMIDKFYLRSSELKSSGSEYSTLGIFKNKEEI